MNQGIIIIVYKSLDEHSRPIGVVHSCKKNINNRQELSTHAKDYQQNRQLQKSWMFFHTYKLYIQHTQCTYNECKKKLSTIIERRLCYYCKHTDCPWKKRCTRSSTRAFSTFRTSPFWREVYTCFYNRFCHRRWPCVEHRSWSLCRCCHNYQVGSSCSSGYNMIQIIYLFYCNKK